MSFIDQTLAPYSSLLTNSERRTLARMFFTAMGFFIAATFSFVALPWAIVSGLGGSVFAWLIFALPVVFIVFALTASRKKDKFEGYLARAVNSRMSEALLLNYGMISSVIPVRVGSAQGFYNLDNELQEGIVSLPGKGEVELRLFSTDHR